MRNGFLLVGLLLFLSASNAMAEYAGFPQRVYRGRTYLIVEPLTAGYVWYAGNGAVRTSADRASTTRTTRITTTKQYYPEK